MDEGARCLKHQYERGESDQRVRLCGDVAHGGKVEGVSSSDRGYEDAERCSCVYRAGLPPMRFHAVMLGNDAARRVIEGIFRAPFPTGGAIWGAFSFK